MRATSAAVPLFFAAAAGALAGLLVPTPVWPLALLAVVVGGAALVSRGVVGRAALLVATAVVLGAFAGALQRAASDTRAASLPVEASVFEGVVDDAGFTQSGARLDLDVTGALVGPPSAAAPRALDAHMQVFVPAGASASLVDVRPGDRVRVRGRARELLPAFSPGDLDAHRLGVARGIDGALSASGPWDIVVVEKSAALRPFSRMRQALRERMTALLPPRLAGLELALLVGDTSLLDDEQRDIYRRVGAGHLLAVSGLQVSLLALLLQRAALAIVLLTSWGRRGRGRSLASALALGGVVAFVLLCGAPPSAVRAALMAGAVLGADLLGRRARALDALGIAGLFTVLASPGSVLDPSFLLSYGAVLGLAATSVQAPLDDEGGGVKRALVATVVASVGAGLVTLPLSAYLFGTVAPAGLVANIVLVPVATVLQVPALALGLAGALLDVHALAWLGAEVALFLEALAAGLGDILPGVRAVSAPSGLLALVLLSIAFVFAAALARRRPLLAASCATIALVVVVVARHEPGGVRIAVLPVGQGDASVIEMPDGTVMLVDGGGQWDGRVDPGADVVLPFLERRGIHAVDVMVLSHPHPDHALGLISVARALPVKELWHNGSPADGPLLAKLLAATPSSTVRTTPELLGRHTFGRTTVDVLAPAPAEKSSLYPELEANDNSLVLRICEGDDCALWPGDIEVLGEELLLDSGADVRASVVKAPHHGSRTSSTAAFIARTHARDVIFCTGPDNTFFFPMQEVIDRWRAAGARLWDTARNGEITVFLTGDGARVMGTVDAEVRAPVKPAD